MSNILIETLKRPMVSEQHVEIVERKGKGHPDYICDSIMEEISVALSREYLKEFGVILHHNIDKGLLVAGQVERRFGGGSVTKPMELIIGDRAVFKVGDKGIPVEDVAIETARSWFKKNMRFIDASNDVIYRVVLSPGSEELSGIFIRSGRLHGANDTSAAVGYAPLTKTEMTVYDIERFLNSQAFKEGLPETGEDVKVMGLRRKDILDITIAMPLISRYVENEKDYFRRKGKVIDTLKEFTKDLPFREVNLFYNTLDKRGHDLGGVYLSLLGTSAEDADSGQVGRGNRVNGVIPLNRPIGTEAAAGKNPTSHVGKIYNILAHELAKKVYNDVEGIREVYIWLLSQIGIPIDRPQLVSTQLILKKGVDEDEIKERVKTIIESSLAGIGQFCEELVKGKYPVC
jgi:S-adenosylmethionine synthetase